MEYQQSDLLKWLRNRAILEESEATSWQLRHAADTIERLQKERDQLGAGGKVWQRTAGHLKQERDAALAEVERTEHERDRSQQALHKAEHDRDSLLAEVERLKSSLTIVSGVSEDFKSRLTAAPRCQLCGERVEPPRSFCSICCAQ